MSDTKCFIEVKRWMSDYPKPDATIAVKVELTALDVDEIHSFWRTPENPNLLAVRFTKRAEGQCLWYIESTYSDFKRRLGKACMFIE